MISKNKSPVNEFPSNLSRDLTEALERIAKSSSGPRYAAFDADGTLWDTDAGETFFDYQIKNCGLKLPSDPWKHYFDLKIPDPTVAYLWLAQINAGQKLTQVRDWAKACLERHQPWPVLKSQHELIKTLQRLDFEIFIVTASIKWAVEPFAGLVGVDYDHVLGITTEVVDGVITSEPVLPITWREGKAEALLKATSGIRPIFCSGNTYGDIALLEAATHIQLAVSTQDENVSGLFREESRLRDEAVKRGWKQHLFRDLK